ncbi:RNA ligase RtcB family protein [Cronobacter turicensis]|nr:RNA ligase RtcB family protein [Cronobacter turicensis]
MGNFIRPLSDAVAYLASDDLWIESAATQQLLTTARLAGMTRVVGMPDLHPGRGYPIGAAFFSVNRFYPALVGNDIGCGMALWQTSLLTRKLNLDKLEKRLQTYSDIAPADWLEAALPPALAAHLYAASLGSVGGGNHFAELQQIDSVYDDDAIEALGIRPAQLLLLAHSGSRGFGQQILRAHVERFSHDGLDAGSEEASEYLAQHQQALDFAVANRALIARRLLAHIKETGEPVLDVNHNLLAPYTLGDTQGWLHRKGATPASLGPVVIPGSRGDYSYLVQPTGGSEALDSLAHGAGRKWMRTECKGRLSGKFSPAQLSRTAFGSRVICRDRQLIYEEAPQAYKSIESVMQCLTGAGLVKPLARLKPVLTLKTSGERSE